MDALLKTARERAERGDVDGAIAACAEANAAAPSSVEPITTALQILDRTDTGARLVAWADKGLALKPAEGFYLATKAYGHELLGAFDAALVYWRRATTIYGAPHAFALQMGRCLIDAGDLFGAAGVLSEAIADGAPNRAMLERTLGEAKLKGCDISGFPLFQARDRSDGASFVLPTLPTWRGEPLEGRTLLITHHLGFGDQMMLAPMAGLLARRAGRVIMTCDRELKALLAASMPSVEVVAMPRPTQTEAPAPAALTALVNARAPDLHASLLGACAHLGLDEVSEASNAVRLVAPPAAAERARARLENLRRHWPGQRLIGLAFDCVQHRSPGLNPVVRANAARRSVPAGAIARLAESLADHCHFVLLHPDEHLAAIGPAPANTSALAGGLADFAETAGAIEALDGVLTVDSSVANLAGKLGGPTWVMLNAAGEWRWGAAGATTNWFPTLRLLRQRIPGDWDGVIAQAAAALGG